METYDKEKGYQIIVTNIHYGRELTSKIKHRPEMTILDVPESIVSIKDENKFNDSIETFAYNTITKKYGAEVSRCQVYLP